MNQLQIGFGQVPDFGLALREGVVTNQESYHKPQRPRSTWDSRPSCECVKTTPKGAYRDVTIEVFDMTIHFYHQSPVVVERDDGQVRLSSCGYRTSTTKERINRYIPRGYRVYQEDFEWFLSQPSGPDIPFVDGMVIEP